MKTKICSLIIICLIGFLTHSCEEEEYYAKQLTLTGQLISNSTCKNDFKAAVENPIPPDTLSCIDYSFNSLSNKLIIKHINAGFNCCPEKLYCEVSLNNDTIIIQEFEKSALCFCNCLYDLDIEVTGVTTIKYQLKFVEPYCGEQEKLIFEIDLNKEKEGLFCVVRKQYPWGIYSINY